MESARFLFYTRIFPPFQEILHILILKSNAALYPPTPPDNGCLKYRLAAALNIPQNNFPSITASAQNTPYYLHYTHLQNLSGVIS